MKKHHIGESEVNDDRCYQTVRPPPPLPPTQPLFFNLQLSATCILYTFFAHCSILCMGGGLGFNCLLVSWFGLGDLVLLLNTILQCRGLFISLSLPSKNWHSQSDPERLLLLLGLPRGDCSSGKWERAAGGRRPTGGQCQLPDPIAMLGNGNENGCLPFGVGPLKHWNVN